MPGNIAYEKIQTGVTGRDESEIASDGTSGVIVGFDSDAIPFQAARRKAALDARGKLEVFIDLALAVLQSRIRFLQLQFGSLLL